MPNVTICYDPLLLYFEVIYFVMLAVLHSVISKVGLFANDKLQRAWKEVGLDLVEELYRRFAVRTAACNAETSGQPGSPPGCGPKTFGTQV